MSFEDLPVLPVLEEDETPMTVSVELPGRTVLARIWEVQVGRIPLYLLDYQCGRQLRRMTAA